MKQDILNRTEFVDRIVNFVNTLSDMNKGACFAIDGKWGSGKSFVLDMIESKLCEIQSEETADNKFLLAHYNCWQYDYYEEPTVAMVAALLDCTEEGGMIFNPNIDSKIKATWSMFKGDLKLMAGEFSKHHIGINVVEVLERFRDAESAEKEKNTTYDSMFAFRETLEVARNTLAKIAEKKTIILVVDELDRCIPPYAIKVLERLHHFFDDIENIIVVIAVDSAQLNHSVKQIYGENTDEKAYLKKFIQLTFKLDTGEMEGDIFEKYNEYFSMFDFDDLGERESFEEIFQSIWHGIDMRTQEKAIERATVIHDLVAGDHCDPALSLFEVFSVRFMPTMDYKILSLIDMDQAGEHELHKECESKTVEFMKALSVQALTGSYAQTFSSSPKVYHLYDNLIGRGYYYIHKAYSDVEVLGDKRYCLQNNLTYSGETNVAIKFAEMLGIVR